MQLCYDNQQLILKYPSREQEVNERPIKKRKTTNTTASVTTNEVNPEKNRFFAAIINDVQNSSLKKTAAINSDYLDPSNGSPITAAENTTIDNNSSGNNDTSIIKYVHLGKQL